MLQLLRFESSFTTSKNETLRLSVTLHSNSEDYNIHFFLYWQLWILLTRMRSIFQGYIRSQPWRQLFIPTVIFQLFKHVRDYFPNHHFIIADFHYLPGEFPWALNKSKGQMLTVIWIDSVAGINAPTVQRTNNNVIVVERTYLTPKLGENDIFFPINFDQLQVIFKALNPTKNLPKYQTNILLLCWDERTLFLQCFVFLFVCSECVVSTKRFMRTHAEFSNTCTILRYNPLLEDFTNTSFFLSQGL